MRGEENGIILSKGEMEMLLAFALPDSLELGCVVFETDISTVTAHSLDGYAGVCGTGDNAGFRTESARWRVELQFLETVKKALGAKDFALLEFSGASLHSAVVLEVLENDGEPVLEERTTLTCPHDACLKQGELPFADRRDIFAAMTNDKGVPQEASPRYMKRLGGFEKIGTGPVVVHAGRSAKHGTTYSAKSHDGTEWIVVVKPPGEEKPRGGRKAKESANQLSLDEAADE